MAPTSKRPEPSGAGRLHPVYMAEEATEDPFAGAARLLPYLSGLRLLLDTAPVMLWAFDRDGIVTLAEGRGLAAIGLADGVPVGRPLSEIFAGERDVEDAVALVLAGEDIQRTFALGPLMFATRLSPVLDHGQVCGGVAVALDMTDAALEHESVVAREARFRSLVQKSTDIVMIFDVDGTITYVSPSISLHGWDPDEMLGKNGWELSHPDDVAKAMETVPRLLARPGASVTWELRSRDAFGNYRWIEEVLTNHLDDPAVRGVIGNLRDITGRKLAEQALARLARTDDLTELANRTEFTDRLEISLSEAQAAGGRVTVAFVDLDHFKLVNDSLGHAAGDELLQEVARRLGTLVRGDDIVARFGGDEFVVLCVGGSDDMPVALARRLASAFSGSIELAKGPITVTASIGVSTLAPAAPGAVPDDPARLLREADEAMYRAKQKGRARVEFFDEGFSPIVVAADRRAHAN